MNKGNCVVSVLCATYNHEKYIKDALEGFVNQITNFEYEVLVHDDASSDETANIIREYEQKYPNLVKGFYEEENQYSKGVRIRDILTPYIHGRYIACCDGDDYWIDKLKLQKQVDYLENHPEYSACVTGNKVISYLGGDEQFQRYDNHDCEIDMRDIIMFSNRKYHFSTLVYRYSCHFIPQELEVKNVVGDYKLAIWLVLNGKIHYIDELMSVYRANVPGGWTDNQNTGNYLEKETALSRKLIEMLNKYDEFSKYQYSEIFQAAKRNYEITILENEHRYKDIIKKYPEYLKRCTVKEQCQLLVKAYLPNVYIFYKKVQLFIRQ